MTSHFTCPLSPSDLSSGFCALGTKEFPQTFPGMGQDGGPNLHEALNGFMSKCVGLFSSEDPASGGDSLTVTRPLSAAETQRPVLPPPLQTVLTWEVSGPGLSHECAHRGGGDAPTCRRARLTQECTQCHTHTLGFCRPLWNAAFPRGHLQAHSLVQPAALTSCSVAPLAGLS